MLFINMLQEMAELYEFGFFLEHYIAARKALQ
jgi:hypothetical protein